MINPNQTLVISINAMKLGLAFGVPFPLTEIVHFRKSIQDNMA